MYEWTKVKCVTKCIPLGDVLIINIFDKLNLVNNNIPFISIAISAFMQMGVGKSTQIDSITAATECPYLL